jgi:hypothetical protein
MATVDDDGWTQLRSQSAAGSARFAGMCVGRRPLRGGLRTPALTPNRTLPLPAIPAVRLSLNSPTLTRC